ncbi:MAG: hypothetical protein C5B48_13175, partial [Candidatus Rokuibacteriota bacterium]
MNPKSYRLSSLVLLLSCLLGPDLARAQDAQSLKREFEAMRQEFEAMKKQYEERMRELGARIQTLES